MITLYGMSSPNVRKILIALEEMGLAYRSEHVAVFRSAQFDPDFVKLNPISKVPVIVDPDGAGEDCPIFESGAILIYLAERYAPEFYPAEGTGRWQALKWLMVQIANVGPIFGQHSHFRLRHGEHPYAATRFRQTAARLYHVLEERLAAVPFLAGDFYSIADMATYPWVRYLARHGLDPTAFPALAAWRRTLEARPAVIRADTAFRAMGTLDAADRAAASPEDGEKLLWRHFPAPSAEQAGTSRGSGG